MKESDLTPNERKKLYFSGHEVDHIPYSLTSSETSCEMYGINSRDYYLNADCMVEVEKRLVEEFDTGSVVAGDGLKGIAEGMGSKISYPLNSISIVEKPVVEDYSILPQLSFNPAKDGRFPLFLEALKRLKELFGEERSVETNIGSPITVCAALRGTERMLLDTYKHPEELHQLLQLAVDASLQWVKFAYEQCEPNFGIVNPVGSGSLLSLKQYERFELPYLKQLVTGIKQITGQTPGMHMCGKSRNRWNSFREIGLSALSVDNCERLTDLKAELGNDMVISGNVPPVDVIMNGDRALIQNTVKECLLDASDSPCGFVLSPGCELPFGVSRDNLWAFIEAAEYYGQGAQIGQLCKGLRGE